MTQRHVGIMLWKTHPDLITRYESAKIGMSAAKLYTSAAIFRMPISFFFEEELRLQHPGYKTGDNPIPKLIACEESDINKHIGTALAKIRNEMGLGYTKLSRLVGISYTQLMDYEKSTTRISAAALFVIACHLGRPIECFFEGLNDLYPERMPVTLDEYRNILYPPRRDPKLVLGPLKDHGNVNLVVGARLRWRRLQLGLTQQELADHCGLPNHQRVHCFEIGKTPIPLDVLVQLSDALNVTLGYFTDNLQTSAEIVDQTRTAA